MKRQYIHSIRNGEKTVEGRIAERAVLKYAVGDQVEFYYFTNSSDRVRCQIHKIEKFNSFKEMLVATGFKACVPQCENLQEAIEAYDRIPKYKEKARVSGVFAIHLTVLKEISS